MRALRDMVHYGQMMLPSSGKVQNLVVLRKGLQIYINLSNTLVLDERRRQRQLSCS
jgi:hypothetical protein